MLGIAFSLPPLFVTSGILRTNVVPAQVFGASHGFADHYLFVNGWPIIYRRYVVSLPQSGLLPAEMNTLPSMNSADWLSPVAFLSDALLSGFIVCSTMAVTARICRVVRVRQVTVAECLWSFFAASLAIAATMHVQNPAISAEWFGADTDSPRLTTLLWYPDWVQYALQLGMVCSALTMCWASIYLPKRLFSMGGERH